MAMSKPRLWIYEVVAVKYWKKIFFWTRWYKTTKGEKRSYLTPVAPLRKSDFTNLDTRLDHPVVFSTQIMPPNKILLTFKNTPIIREKTKRRKKK